jgi:hypothetical protein
MDFDKGLDFCQESLVGAKLGVSRVLLLQEVDKEERKNRRARS